MTINTVDSLREHLQWSVEIEHGTLPPYLCALYSIKEGHNKEAAEVIHSVFMEEMLHLTLAANVLNAVGGSPELDSPRLMPAHPIYLPHSNEAFQVSLAKFSPESVETFLQIERPSDHEGLPEDDSYETIGQFYEAIEEALVRLCDELGEEQLFSGDPARQITSELYYGGAGEIVVVTDLKSALAALDEVVEQGEGLQHEEIWDGDRNMFHPEREDVAHYFRFNEIRLGRRHQAGDTPQSGPTGEVFNVEWDAVHNMRPNPTSSDYPVGSRQRQQIDEFNHTYSGILHLIHEALNGSPRLLAVATGAMYGLKQQAVELMSLPSGDGDTTVGPSFEYVPPEDRHHASAEERRIVILRNGPYLVYGDIPLVRKRKIVSETGDAVNWATTEVLETEETYALCRCGRSGAKPFCDGTHERIGFEGAETADIRVTAERRRTLGGTGIVVKRDGPLCMHASFCVGRTRKIAEMLPDSDDSDVRAQIMGMIERCPSGSFAYALGEGGEDVEPHLPLAIAVTEEEDSLAASLWVTGEIPITRSDGEPFEIRNRVTLCRCGQSKTKPLCDGTHRDIAFRE